MTYANRGMTTELVIETSCKQYEQRNLAVIRKIPTPVKVLSNRNGRVSGFYEKKSTVDFNGVLKGGRSIAFDAKETKGKSLSFNNIQQHQLDYMKSISKMNGIAFILVCFSELDVYYRLDIKDLIGYIKEPWKTNEKSIPIKFFETYAVEVKSDTGIYLDFLKGLHE